MPAKLRAAAAPHPISSHLSINHALSVHHQLFSKLFNVTRIETGSQELLFSFHQQMCSRLFLLIETTTIALPTSSKFQYPVPSFRCESERGKPTEVGVTT
jgi:hypothetical protein